jgi:tellurite resistance protein TehA-like permease
MDWFFRPLGNFFEWSFQYVEKLNMGFNWFFIAIGTILTVWWMIKMIGHPKEKY